MVIEAQYKIFFCIVLTLCLNSSFSQETVSMKDYVDMQARLNREWTEKLLDVQIQNINDNVNKANASMEKRLDGMNEFRQTLKDSNATYVTWQALIGLIIGVSGFLFGYANYRKNQESSAGKNIVSGDKVEVKK